MRITKKQMREAKMYIMAMLANLAMYDHERLKLLVRAENPNMLGFHPKGTCPNCGAADKEPNVQGCKCGLSEQAMAAGDATPGNCIRILLMAEIEKRIPSALVD